jgi:hypothetical protein
MNISQNPYMIQKLERFSSQIIGYALTAGMAATLIVAWVLTGPLFQLVEQAAHRGKLKMKHKRGKL